MNVFDIIETPILTERTFEMIKSKRYVFRVKKEATKGQIREAIEKAFPGVVVKRVNTARYKGKEKRQGKHVGFKSDWKKAYVLLSEASKPIEFFEGLQ